MYIYVYISMQSIINYERERETHTHRRKRKARLPVERQTPLSPSIRLCLYLSTHALPHLYDSDMALLGCNVEAAGAVVRAEQEQVAAAELCQHLRSARERKRERKRQRD